MREFKLIVAGGRDFNDLALFIKALMSFEKEHSDKEISLVSGMAKGADQMAYMFAKRQNIQCYPFPANWEQDGKQAGYERNARMGCFADGLLAFWDGESRGTKHMIDFMKNQGKPTTIVRY